MDGKDELIIFEKGQEINMRSFQDPEKEFVLIPFLGYYYGFAGVGYVDLDGNEVISNCRGNIVSYMPIVTTWRAFQIIKSLDMLTVGLMYQVWHFARGDGNIADLQELSSTGVITPSWCENILHSLPNDDFVVEMATKAIMANKWFDVDELRSEYAHVGKQVPAVIESYEKLMGVIKSQDAVLSRINNSVMMEMKGVKNPYH